MSATTAIILDTRRPLKDGTYPVKLRVTHNRAQKYYPTPFNLSKEDFEKSQGGKPRHDYKDISLKLQANERRQSTLSKSYNYLHGMDLKKSFSTIR
ncbi:hypothetical protein EXU57_15900 [Segetibacter sp. 3557_3]|uniref:Arm DNA-binding domain-containing protein n=1 Tax=Segetibacter sp. 3557_3 TaxID=2547429 RepID=UPI001058BBA0|nr:hypothetical protein EXU57_15900 [Segetibacter sp. 3557_3]